MQEEHDNKRTGIRHVIRVLRRRVLVIALCFVLTPLAAYAFSASQQKMYSSSSSLLFRDPQFDQKLFGSQSLPPSTDPAREAATNVKLVSLEAVAARTARKLGRLSGDKISKKVSAASDGQSNVVTVTATDPSPRFAALLANTFASEYVEFRRDADRSKIRQGQVLLRTQLDQTRGKAGGSGRERTLLQQLDVLGSLQTGNAEVVQRASPSSSPSSPKTMRNTVLGVLVGLLLGVGLALLLERLDRRLRDPSEMEGIFGRPVLGAVGESRALSRGASSLSGVAAGEREAFRMLRANLRYFNVDHTVASVLVTSAAPGDGKTTVAWNLAATAAEGGRVLLIEADLRHPSVAEGLGLRDVAGLSTVLAGQAEIEDVVQEIPVEQGGGSNGSRLRTVHVLLSGPLPPNPSDLLQSDRMHEIVEEAERDYDLVVIDTPPTSVVSDAVPLVKQVGGVIVVGRLGKTTRESAEHLHNQLLNLNAPVLGVVVNALRSSDSDGYGYGYGYGDQYGEKASETMPATPQS